MSHKSKQPDSATAPEPSPAESLAPAPTPAPSQQSLAVRARWAAEEESEQAIEAYFTSSVEVDEGLNLLARMRRNAEIAARALNARITVDDTRARCAFCGGPKKPNRQWAMIKPQRDPETRQVTNIYLCDVYCIAMWNKKTQGISVVSDRGVIKDKEGNATSV